MRIPHSETVVIKPELIRLVRRVDSKKWQVHYKLENVKTWFRRSTDSTDIKEATKIAERIWMKATFDHEEGRPITSKKFKNVSDIVLQRLLDEIEAGTAKPSARDKSSGIEGASSHSGRRTFLTSLANRGTAIHILKTLAGHRSISTTAAYLYSSPSQLKAAVELV